MWSINGMMAIPADPQLQITNIGNSKGNYINFRAVTEGEKRGEEASYQYWDCSMWVPNEKTDYWKEQIVPGNVFLVKHSYATSYPVQEGKYHNTRIRLEYNKVKKLQKAMWTKE